jgi:hypothetical protein
MDRSLCQACWAQDGQGVEASPHEALVRIGYPRLPSTTMRLLDQDYMCSLCGRDWLLKRDNRSGGWVRRLPVATALGGRRRVAG